jgi:hypothetical protein
VQQATDIGHLSEEQMRAGWFGPTFVCVWLIGTTGAEFVLGWNLSRIGGPLTGAAFAVAGAGLGFTLLGSAVMLPLGGRGSAGGIPLIGSSSRRSPGKLVHKCNTYR